jgi:hypothetical protein
MNVVDVQMDETAPVLIAEIWRVDLADKVYPGNSLLHVYWESEPADLHSFWACGDSICNWIFVEKDHRYEVKPTAIRRLYASKDGEGWEYFIRDYAEALIVILPSGMGAVETSPRAQATLKGGRLILFFTRTGILGNWTATAKLCRVSSASTLMRVAGELNRAHYKDNQERGNRDKDRLARPIGMIRTHVELHDPMNMPGPDRSLQAALWGIIVASVALLVAAEALTHGQVKTFGVIFGAAAAAITAVWLVGAQVVPHYRGKRIAKVSASKHS